MSIKIIYKGFLQDTPSTTAIPTLARLFKNDMAKAEEVFFSGNYVLQTLSSEAEVQLILPRLEKMGLRCEVVDEMEAFDDSEDQEFVANLVTCPSCGYSQTAAPSCRKCKQPFVIKRVNWTVSTQTKEVKKPVRAEEEDEFENEPSFLSSLLEKLSLPSLRTIVLLLIFGSIAASYAGIGLFEKTPTQTPKALAQSIYSKGPDAKELHATYKNLDEYMNSEAFSDTLATELYTHGAHAKDLQAKYKNPEEFMQSNDFDPKTEELISSTTPRSGGGPKNPILMLIKGILTSDPNEVAKTNTYNPESGENPYANKLKSLGIDPKEFSQSTGVKDGEIAIEDLQKTIDSNPLLKKSVDDAVAAPGASTGDTDTDKKIDAIEGGPAPAEEEPAPDTSASDPKTSLVE